jgi:hypothetical protein
MMESLKVILAEKVPDQVKVEQVMTIIMAQEANEFLKGRIGSDISMFS